MPVSGKNRWGSMTMAVPEGFVEMGSEGLTALAGPFFRRSEDKGPCYGFRAEDRHTNVSKTVHGGMLMTFIDEIMGITAWEAIDRQPCATISLTSEFISAPTVGDWIEGRAELIRSTRSLVFVHGTLTVRSTIVLSANGVWKRLRSLPTGELGRLRISRKGCLYCVRRTWRVFARILGGLTDSKMRFRLCKREPRLSSGMPRRRFSSETLTRQPGELPATCFPRCR